MLSCDAGWYIPNSLQGIGARQEPELPADLLSLSPTSAAPHKQHQCLGDTHSFVLLERSVHSPSSFPMNASKSISLMTDISLCQTVFNGSPYILGYLHFPYLPRKNNFRSVWCCPTEISHSRGKRKEYFAWPSPGEIPATSPGDLLSWIVKSMLQPAVKTPCKTAKNSAFIFSYTYCCHLGQIHWSQSSLI